MCIQVVMMMLVWNMFTALDVRYVLVKHTWNWHIPRRWTGWRSHEGRTPGCWESLACLPAWQRSETAGSAREVKAEHDSGTEEWIFNQPHAAAPFEYLMGLFFDDYLPIMVSCQRLKGKALVAIVQAQRRFGVLQGWTLLSVCQLAAFLLPSPFQQTLALARPAVPCGRCNSQEKESYGARVCTTQTEWMNSVLIPHFNLLLSMSENGLWDAVFHRERERERSVSHGWSHMTSEYCDVIKRPCLLTSGILMSVKNVFLIMEVA